MRFLSWVRGYTLLYRRGSEEIRRKFKACSIYATTELYIIVWRYHMFKMANSHSAKTALNYKPRGRRADRKLRKRLWESERTKLGPVIVGGGGDDELIVDKVFICIIHS
jgi:hypothetical protein